MQKIKYRTLIKHRYFKLKKNILNFRLNLITYPKFRELKYSGVKTYENLDNFYSSNNIKIIEGNSAQSSLQIDFLKKYKENFKNILEIGFNAGHSSEVFLSTDPKSQIVSIDIGYWYYCKFGVEFLNSKYPNRLSVIFKDSVLALNNFETVSEDTIFDFIYIDGNHTYEYAYNDMKNCSKFANRNTIVALDDVVFDNKHRTVANADPTQVWKDLLKENFITEIEVAHFTDLNRGVAVGRFNL